MLLVPPVVICSGVPLPGPHMLHCHPPVPHMNQIAADEYCKYCKFWTFYDVRADMPKACTMHRWEDYKTHAPWMLNVPRKLLSLHLLANCCFVSYMLQLVAAHIWLFSVMFILLLFTYLALAFSDCVVQPSRVCLIVMLTLLVHLLGNCI